MEIDSNSSDEEVEVSHSFYIRPSFVLIAIDTHPSMFIVRKDEEGNETSPFQDALSACLELADSLILANSQAFKKFGIVVANEGDNATLFEVEQTILDKVKGLQKLCTLSNVDLQRKFERQTNLDLGGFFLMCKKKFSNITAKIYNKRNLLYITNDDDPVKTDSNKRFTALNEAKTFEPCDISFELLPTSEFFDYTKFYNELLHVCAGNNSASNKIYIDKEGLLEKLSAVVKSTLSGLRCKLYPYADDYSRFLGVKRIHFIKKKTMYNTHYMNAEREVVRWESKPKIGPQHFVLTLNNETLPVNNETYMEVMSSNVAPLGFHLLFVSERLTSVGIVVGTQSFLIKDPDEELNFYDSIWQYCAEENKVLVCFKKDKNPGFRKYVELIPKFANNEKMFLIRKIPACCHSMFPKWLQTAESRSNVPTGVMGNLVEKLTANYDPKMFINIALAKKTAFVRAKLLNESVEVVDDIEDPTDGSEKNIDEHIKEEIKDIKDYFNVSDLPKGTKRKAPTVSSASQCAKAKK